jgi:hypothetical protein
MNCLTCTLTTCKTCAPGYKVEPLSRLCVVDCSLNINLYLDACATTVNYATLTPVTPAPVVSNNNVQGSTSTGLSTIGVPQTFIIPNSA